MFELGNFDMAWVCYAALFLLLIASLSSRPMVLRGGICLIVFVGMLASIHGIKHLALPAILLVILMVNLFQIFRVLIQNAKVRFSAEDQVLRETHFSTLSPSDARRLIDQGYWISARRGETLIRENNAAPSLFYLASGTAIIRRNTSDVGQVNGGELIGEATVLDGSDATGTVLLSTDARLWFVPAQALRNYLAANPGIAVALHEGFARALRGKLASANTRIATNNPL